MGIFQKFIEKRVADVLIKQKATIGPLKDDSTVWRSLRSLSASSTSVGHAFEKSAWVYGAIKAISRNISRVPIKLYEEPDDQEGKPATDFDVTPITSGPLFELFMQPNFLMTGKQFIEATAINLEIYGECFWILERKNVTEIPTEMWIGNPEKFSPIWSEGNRKSLIGWKYKQGQEEIPFSFYEIVFFKSFNPYDDVRGMSPMSSAQLGIDQDYFASNHNKNFFKDGVSISGVIEIPDELTNEAYNRLLSTFEERHKGYSRSHKVALLEGGGKFVPYTPSYKDFEFTSLRKMNKEEILTAFGVNPVVIGDYQFMRSYEGIRAAHRAFWIETLVPKLEYMADTINWNFLSKIQGGNLKFKFDLNAVEALREDFYRKVDAAERLYQIGFPINMVNKRLDLGMDDVEWGDIWWVDQNKVPAGTQPVEPAKASEGAKTFAIDCKAHPTAHLFESKLRKFLFEQRKLTLQSLAKSLSDYKKYPFASSSFKVDSEIKKLEGYLRPLYHETIMSTCSEFTDDIINAMKEANADELINVRSHKIALVLVGNIEQNITNLVKTSIDNNENPDETLQKVKKFYNFAASKCLTISKEETDEVARIIKDKLTMTHIKPNILLKEG